MEKDENIEKENVNTDNFNGTFMKEIVYLKII